MKTHRTSDPPAIDGILSEATWKESGIATDFFQYDPVNGGVPYQNTIVRILYDNRSIYVGAMMYDSSPDSILTELGKRDERNLNADYFAVDISPYNDGQNSFEFRILASGIQVDVKHYAGDSDPDWDAVWASAVSVTDSGWIAELEIPYSTLRFPQTEEQVWGINFWREVRRIRETSSWNFVNKRIDGIRNQSGTLTGIRGIKPPLRLSMEPYVSGYIEQQPGTDKPVFAYNYGADIKLGINESFTLDVTLIPDFGQVPSDDQIVNLSPFETYYSEKRQFFTEGTELFNKGGIFYSRRIGGVPERYYDVRDQLNEGEYIGENPGETQLINASKISGRTSGGLGIGVFNAMTSATNAKVVDSTGESRRVLTQPFTNYNMVVFDQSLRNNSYVSAYNTNVLMPGFDYSANVTGTEFRIANRSNVWAVTGLLNVSQKYRKEVPPELGHRHYIKAEKVSGNFLFGAYHNVETDLYDPNDMGFLSKNNDFNNGLFFEYNFYDPFGIFLNMEHELDIDYLQLYAPRKYVTLDFDYSLYMLFINQLTAGFDAGIRPVEYHDYFEARVPDKMVIHPPAYSFSAFVSPDYTKKFLVDVRGGYGFSKRYRQSNYNLRLGPRLRISDKIFMSYTISYDQRYNDLGYVTDSLASSGDPVIVMGMRDIRIIENRFNLNLAFSPEHAVTFRLRHYWFTADYQSYYDLANDGTIRHTGFPDQYDFNYNAFNIDTYYTWRFAPGSEMVIAWKNAIISIEDYVIHEFLENLDNTFSIPGTNSLSVKILYYIDYQMLKKRS